MAGIYDYLYGPGGILQPSGNPMPFVANPLPSAYIDPNQGDFPTLGASLSGAQYANPQQTAGSVGGNVGNVPLPRPRPPEVPLSRPPDVPLPLPRPPDVPLPGPPEVPLPRPRPPEVGPNYASLNTGPRGQQGAGGGTPSLRDALRGATAPAPPQAQTVRTPPPPQLAPIKGGEFINLLSSLGIGPQEFMRMRLGGR